MIDPYGDATHRLDAATRAVDALADLAREDPRYGPPIARALHAAAARLIGDAHAAHLPPVAAPPLKPMPDRYDAATEAANTAADLLTALLAQAAPVLAAAATVRSTHRDRAHRALSRHLPVDPIAARYKAAIVATPWTVPPELQELIDAANDGPTVEGTSPR